MTTVPIVPVVQNIDAEGHRGGWLALLSEDPVSLLVGRTLDDVLVQIDRYAFRQGWTRYRVDLAMQTNGTPTQPTMTWRPL